MDVVAVAMLTFILGCWSSWRFGVLVKKRAVQAACHHEWFDITCVGYKQPTNRQCRICDKQEIIRRERE